jgi:hypothetical protein
MDQAFKKNLTTERMMILTADVLIEGTIFHHQEIRLSDALNAPQFRDNPYLTLSDALVRKIETNHVVLRSKVLLVARGQILCITPRSEVTSDLPCRCDGAACEKVETPALAAAEPPSPPERLKEKRSGPRRMGGLLPVQILNGGSKAVPFEGWVLDNSAGGMRLTVKRSIPTGTVLSVRPSRAARDFPWIKVQVRGSTTEKGTTKLSCRFVSRPSVEERLQFG